MNSLRLERLGKSFGGLDAVRDLSFSVDPGRVTGLIGPNGAGKTTVVNLISGLYVPTNGRILFGDNDISGFSPHRIARAGIVRTFQTVRLLEEASVLDNIVIGFHRYEQTSLLVNLFGLPAAWRERREFRARALELLSRFAMSEYAELPAAALSYGHQRRIEVLRALAAAPAFLLLDEPVAGMNDQEAEALGRTIRDLTRSGVGVLLIEHNMRLVMNICEVVHVIDSGQLIASGPPAAVSADPAVIAAYLGK